MISFESQLGQDKFVAEYFKYKREGYFIEIGAWNGQELSNTYFLEYELGWTGIVVEPHPDAYNNIYNVRGCLSENAAVISGLVPVTEVWFLDKSMSSVIVPGPGPDVIKVPAETSHEILTKHSSPLVIDYLSIDVNGTELELIKSFPFHLYRVLVISVQHNNYLGPKYEERRREMRKVLGSSGFKFERKLDCDDIFIRPC